MGLITWRHAQAGLFGIAVICSGLGAYPVFRSGGAAPYTVATVFWFGLALASLAGSFAAEYQYWKKEGRDDMQETGMARYVLRRVLFVILVLMIVNMGATVQPLTF